MVFFLSKIILQIKIKLKIFAKFIFKISHPPDWALGTRGRTVRKWTGRGQTLPHGGSASRVGLWQNARAGPARRRGGPGKIVKNMKIFWNFSLESVWSGPPFPLGFPPASRFWCCCWRFCWSPPHWRRWQPSSFALQKKKM